MLLLRTLFALGLIVAPAVATTQAPILTAPVSSTTYKSPIPLTYTLPDVPLHDSVHLLFTGTGGSITFSLPDAQSGNYSWDPSTDPAMSIGVPADAASLADGTYTVVLSYQNAAADPAASAFATSVVIDTATQAPALNAPVAMSTITSTVPIDYSLPETPLSGTVQLKFDGPNGHLALTLNDATSASFSWDPQTNPALLSQVVSVTGGTSLADGTYDVTLRYRDAIGNATASTLASGVIVATQTTSTTTTTTTTSVTATTVTTTTGATATTTTQPTCTGGVAIGNAVLRITHVDAVAANEKLLFKGVLAFAAGAPAGSVPVASGAQLWIRPAANPSAPDLFALTTANGDPIPAGSPGTGCGPKDGWTGLRYANRSGFVDPPSCTRSAHGLRVFRLRDRRAQGKGIAVTAKTARTTITDQAPTGAIAATVGLGGTEADLLGGACGVVVFQAADCALDGRIFRCRSGASPHHE